MTGYVTQSWLLAPLYLAGVGLVLGVAFLIGGVWQDRSREKGFGFGLYVALRRFALGLAIASFAASVLGLIGAFRAMLVFPLLVFLAAAGWRRGPVQPELAAARTDLKHMRAMFRHLCARRRWLAVLPLGAFCLLVVNVVMGGLSPPMGHDAMWYHLAVPRQWTFSGRFDCYPDVMPSNYPLAGNALYAILLLGGGNAAFCNAFYASVGVGLLLAMAAASSVLTAAMWRRSRAVAAGYLCLVVWAPMVARESLIGPAMAQNDVFAMLWVLVGFTELWLTMGRAETGRRGSLQAGFLLGTAAAAKLVVVLAVASAPLIPLLLMSRGRYVAAIRQAVVLSAGIACGYLPWALRGWWSNGLPFFPLGSTLFPPTLKFERALRTSQEWNGLLAPGQTGLAGAWDNFNYKLSAAATSGAAGVYMFIVAAVLCAVLLRGPRRVYGLLLCFFLSAIFLMQGGLEVLRYFSLYFPLAAAAVSWVLLEVLGRSRRPLLPVALVLGLFSFGGYVTRQMLQASAPIFDYGYRPVLSRPDLTRRGRVTELGNYYLGATAWKPQIPPDERVFLPDCRFPFYLDRDTLWNDLATHGGVADQWHAMSPEEALRFLQEQQIEAVLYTKLEANASIPDQLQALINSGRWHEVPAPQATPSRWRLFARSGAMSR